ncbi:MAG: carboxylating nicotinate-nucleotide diphosphorylase [Chitinivibrionales bacterium]|nr:carboxylating nicotinate-nucleotide diphosphorylase [Chitinivibrionales bacterium]
MHDEKAYIRRLISQALSEDFGREGDITTKALFDETAKGYAVIKSKQFGCLSGSYLIDPVFKTVDPTLHVRLLKQEGAALEPGVEICHIEGNLRGILSAERTILNFLQRLSGIATLTAAFVAQVEGTTTRILDTRKTTPTMRLLEKKAVLAGGGCNHRFGLFDMILIKDTHVKAACGPFNAVKYAQEFRSKHQLTVPIEVEVQSVQEYQEAACAGPQRIMLDNMSLPDMAACVRLRNEHHPSIELEASGNITLGTIRSVGQTGVDFASVGALTHSAPSLDIHLVLT